MTHLNFFTVCWWIFIIVWVVTGFSVKPVKEKQDWGGRAFTLVIIAVMFLFLASDIPWPALNERRWPYNDPIRFVAYALTLAGLMVMIWARIILGTNWSAAVTFREGHELIQRGPYRWVRHPIYTGMLLMVAGTALAVGSAAGIVALVIGFLGHWWKLRQEEKLMMGHFPEAYPLYRRRTKALIPFLF